MNTKEIAATCHTLAARADALDNRVPIVSGEAVARLARCFALDEDARILFNMLVMNLAAEAEAAR